MNLDKIINKYSGSFKNQSKILIVDDQVFNINALLIIMKYNIKIEVEKVCESCFDGFKAIEKIEEDVKKQLSERM